MHIVPGLGVGGAERFLLRLSERFAALKRADQLVVSIDPIGESSIFPDFVSTPVVTLNARSSFSAIRAIPKLQRLTAEFAPDIIQSWMYRADFMALFAHSTMPSARLIWNLRCSDAPRPIKSHFFVKLCALLSRHGPDVIIACGHKARDYHVKRGYVSDRIVVINNGFKFGPVIDRRLVQKGLFILGAAGRFHAAKDYGLLLDAVKCLIMDGDSVRLIIVGRDCCYDNPWFASRIDALGIREHVDLRGEIGNMDGFYSEIDIFCLTSVSEGFPNVLCEAMGNGVPVVSTASGDSADIVHDVGIVTPVSDLSAFVTGLKEMMAMSPEQLRALGKRASDSVRIRFDLDRIVGEYIDVYSGNEEA